MNGISSGSGQDEVTTQRSYKTQSHAGQQFEDSEKEIVADRLGKKNQN